MGAAFCFEKIDIMIKNLNGSNISFEQDGKLSFDEEAHRYFIGDIDMRPVSSVVGMFFKEFDAELVSLKKCNGNTLEAAKLREVWTCKGCVASQAGTFLHKQIEDYFNGKAVPELLCDVNYEGKFVKHSSTIDISREWSYFKAFERAVSPVPFRTEWRVYDLDSRMAGTLDLVCACEDGTYEIYDWKRSCKVDAKEVNQWASGLNGLYHLTDTSYVHYCLQQNLYRYMLQKNYGIKISRMNLVVLHPEHENYRLVPVPVMDKEIAIIIDKIS